ncbi:aminoglycoside phosphotransferase family protein [Candidatus Falkowbacteria bacterium]|nr:aminoglycoside phosphotransferase family protein [Candidatus Falkowbacteria bacterium]
MHNTKTRLLTIIKNVWPDFTWKSAKYISTGFDHDIIILDNATVFRLPKKEDSVRLLKNEIVLLKILSSRISLKVPNYHLVSKDFLCTAYPIIKGEELDINTFNNLSSKKQHLLAKQISLFLSELHSTPLKKVAHLELQERFSLEELNELRNDADSYLHSRISKKEKGEIDEYFSSLSKVFHKSPKKVLVHGDFSGDNMVIDQHGKLVGVIDFADRAIHDPAFDFIFLWEFGRPFVEDVCDSYQGSKSGLIERSRAFAQANAIWNMVQVAKCNKPGLSKWRAKFKKLK